MKKKLLRCTTIVAVLAMLIGTLTGCALLPAEEIIPEPSLLLQSYGDYQIFLVRSGTLKQGLGGTATLQSVYYSKNSFSNNGGVIKSVNVKMGDMVKKGDILVEIEGEGLKENYESLLEQYNNQQTIYNEIVDKYKKGTATELDLNSAVVLLNQLKSQYENAKSLYENSTLIAKVDGEVVYLNSRYTSGDKTKLVRAGEVIVGIDDKDPKYLYAAISTDNISVDQYKEGIVLDLSNAGTTFQCKIVSDMEVQEQTGVTELSGKYIYCQLIDPPAGIAHGDIYQYSYISDTADNVLYIPFAAVNFDADGQATVDRLNDSNVKETVNVVTGFISMDNMVEIKSGLSQGDKVIVG
ncbi:MAG: biotin/lipoyl-binding protein [Clostridiales bacterium]|jgi:multidrug efflux pump subunit AcrA (membrane-fusion protein)|nr:biotin/lipoyl-binding protein [Clostridiales bacterium]